MQEEQGSTRVLYLRADRYPFQHKLMTSRSLGLYRRHYISFVTRSLITGLMCVVSFVIVQALLQPMCLSAQDEAVRPTQQLSGSCAHRVDWVYGNARGLRQGCGDFRSEIAVNRPTFFAALETHQDGDPGKQFVPYGYKVICRLDRSMHGGGLLLDGRKHLLIDRLDLKHYHKKNVAEMVGIIWGGQVCTGFYITHPIRTLHRLFSR